MHIGVHLLLVPRSYRDAIRSSFFWLGLVASLFLGLFLTVFRTRNARVAATQALAARRQFLVRPELWEVSITPDAVVGAGDTVVRRWGELLVRRLSISVMQGSDLPWYVCSPCPAV